MFVFIAKQTIWCHSKHWVGVRVLPVPSSLLLAFLPKVGNESGQASYSRIPSDYSSQEGG